ncbi:CBO0543 family protein [Bacillus sp. 22-7]|nr:MULTISPECIES: CBO0543 family protein [Bacillaceae]
MHLFYNFFFLLAGLKWGDWRNWREYYPTILFFIGGDLLKNFLFRNYPMWQYKETIFAENILIGHPIINLMIMAIVYPVTILIFIGRYPAGLLKQAGWILLWVFLYTSIEFINLYYLNLIEHLNGWSIQWSFFFNVFMFIILRIHHNRPLAAVGIGFIWIIFLWKTFEVPIDLLR